MAHPPPGPTQHWEGASLCSRTAPRGEGGPHAGATGGRRRKPRCGGAPAPMPHATLAPQEGGGGGGLCGGDGVDELEADEAALMAPRPHAVLGGRRRLPALSQRPPQGASRGGDGVELEADESRAAAAPPPPPPSLTPP